MFMELSTAVCRLEEGNILAERELEFASANNAPLTALAEFLEGARTQITQIFESLISSRVGELQSSNHHLSFLFRKS